MDVDIKDIYKNIQKDLELPEINPALFSHLEKAILKKNKLCFHYKNEALKKILNFLDKNEVKKLCLIKTPKWNHIIINKTVLDLLNEFDGKKNLKSIYHMIRSYELNFFVMTLEVHHYLLKLEHMANDIVQRSIDFSLKGKFEYFIRLIKILYQNNLVGLTGYNPVFLNQTGNIINTGKINFENIKVKTGIVLHPIKDGSAHTNKVLLLGDTVGTSTTGLLYIASYLRRNGIEAYCQWNDPWVNKQLLIKNIKKLLRNIQPDIIAISIKWFPHIARALEICKTIKKVSPSVKVVAGGDSATYYWKDIIKYEFIDYVILGEGELPLLKLSLNSKDIPNCIYKQNGKIVSSLHQYVQKKESNKDIYLSHLDKIFATPIDPYYAFSIFIPAGRGCAANCFYCAGCQRMQKKNFGRNQPYFRNIEAVRRDIIEAKEYVGTILFDFEIPNADTLDYYYKLWHKIDLSNHHCWLYFWTLPNLELLQFISNTFKYVYVNIDLCSLSESHRLKLTKLKAVKPQPNDEELFEFLDNANKFANLEIYINLIAGLPYFGLTDIEESNRVLSKIITKYRRFASLFWGRLHAQPGALLTSEANKYGMKSMAENFNEFMHYSKLNLNADIYPELTKLNYPLIKFEDTHLEEKVTTFYNNTQRKLMIHGFKREAMEVYEK